MLSRRKLKTRIKRFVPVHIAAENYSYSAMLSEEGGLHDQRRCLYLRLKDQALLEILPGVSQHPSALHQYIRASEPFLSGSSSSSNDNE